MSSRSRVFSTDEAPCWWSVDEAKLPHSNIWLVSYKLLIHIDNETLWLDLNPRETSEVWSWWSPFLPPFSGTCCSNETSNSKINFSWYSDWWLYWHPQLLQFIPCIRTSSQRFFSFRSGIQVLTSRPPHISRRSQFTAAIVCRAVHAVAATWGSAGQKLGGTGPEVGDVASGLP